MYSDHCSSDLVRGLTSITEYGSCTQWERQGLVVSTLYRQPWFPHSDEKHICCSDENNTLSEMTQQSLEAKPSSSCSHLVVIEGGFHFTAEGAHFVLVQGDLLG